MHTRGRSELLLSAAEDAMPADAADDAVLGEAADALMVVLLLLLWCLLGVPGSIVLAPVCVQVCVCVSRWLHVVLGALLSSGGDRAPYKSAPVAVDNRPSGELSLNADETPLAAGQEAKDNALLHLQAMSPLLFSTAARMLVLACVVCVARRTADGACGECVCGGAGVCGGRH